MTRRFFFASLLVLATWLSGTTAPLVAHDEFRFIGSITQVNLAKNQFTMKYKEFDGKEDSVTVTLIAKTVITRNDKPVAKTELKVGVNLVVDALGCEDIMEAALIRIVPATGR